MMNEHLKLHFGQAAKGYVGIMNRNQGPPMFCRVKELDQILARRSPQDLYFTLNTFARPNHASENVWQHSAVYVGCDTRVKGVDPEDALEEMKRAYFGTRTLPKPSYVILSGNGVWVVWLINPVTMGSRKRWLHVQSHFHEVLWLFGPDKNDASKYIRVAGGTNSTSNSKVRLEVISGKRYTLDSLLRYTPPLPAPAQSPQRQQKPPNEDGKPVKRHRKPSLLLRIRDLETLCDLRRGRLDHCRNHLLTIYASTVYTLTQDENAVLTAVLALNERLSSPLPTSQVRAIARTCIRKRYKWCNETIIERLQMTEAEQRLMRTVMAKALAKQVRSEQAEAMAKDVHNRFSKARERVQAVQALKAAGVVSNREIARRLGITEGAVRHVLKRLNKGA